MVTSDAIKRLEDAGCAAVVLHSLFEEQIAAAFEPSVSTQMFGLHFAASADSVPAASEYPLGLRDDEALARHEPSMLASATGHVEDCLAVRVEPTESPSYLRRFVLVAC